MINFVKKYISQYDDNKTKEKDTDRNIETRDKYKVDFSFPILKLLKENDRAPLLHISRKNIKYVETDKMIHQFHVGYMSMLFSKQNKTFREKIDFFNSEV